MVCFKSMQDSQVCPKCGSRNVLCRDNIVSYGIFNNLLNLVKPSSHQDMICNRKCRKCGHTWFDHKMY